MRAYFLRNLRLLTVDAVRDALRRRILFAVLLVCFFAVFALDQCTAFWNGSIIAQGQRVPLEHFGRAAALPIFSILSLALTLLAALLASDELTRPLESGAANLILARPVGRASYVLARLLGPLVVTWVIAVLLFGIGTALFAQRQNAPPLPGLFTALACAGCTAVAAALAMILALWLSRFGTIALGAAALCPILYANAAALIGFELKGSWALVNKLAPPFLSSVVLAVAPWVPDIPIYGNPQMVAAQLIAWVVGSVLCLIIVFRRTELPH